MVGLQALTKSNPILEMVRVGESANEAFLLAGWVDPCIGRGRIGGRNHEHTFVFLATISHSAKPSELEGDKSLERPRKRAGKERKRPRRRIR